MTLIACTPTGPCLDVYATNPSRTFLMPGGSIVGPSPQWGAGDDSSYTEQTCTFSGRFATKAQEMRASVLPVGTDVTTITGIRYRVRAECVGVDNAILVQALSGPADSTGDTDFTSGQGYVYSQPFWVEQGINTYDVESDWDPTDTAGLAFLAPGFYVYANPTRRRSTVNAPTVRIYEITLLIDTVGGTTHEIRLAQGYTEQHVGAPQRSTLAIDETGPEPFWQAVLNTPGSGNNVSYHTSSSTGLTDRSFTHLIDPHFPDSSGLENAASARIRIMAMSQSGYDQTLVWGLNSNEDDWWTIGGQWNLPGDGALHTLDVPIDPADPNIFWYGRFGSSSGDGTVGTYDVKALGAIANTTEVAGSSGDGIMYFDLMNQSRFDNDDKFIWVYAFQVFVTIEDAAPAAPIADFTWELDESGRMVHFDGTSSTSSVPIDTWLWDFNDTVLIPIDQPNGVPVLDHQFFALGPFEVTLTITAGGETVGVTKTVDLSPNAISGDYDNDRPAFSGAT